MDRDLPEGFKEIIAAIGLDAAISLVESLGGITLYIPKKDTLERRQRNIEILAEFNGSNHNELALKHNLSAKQIREIINYARYKKPTIEDFIRNLDDE